MTNSSTTLDPAIPNTTGSRRIRANNSRVAKVFNRLRRKIPSDLPKRIRKSGTESFDRLDKERSEKNYDVCKIASIEYSDDYLSCNNEVHLDENVNQKQPKPKQIQPSVSNSKDASLSQCLGAWCK